MAPGRGVSRLTTHHRYDQDDVKPKEIAAASNWLPFALPPNWTSASLDQLSPHSLVDGDWIETKDQSESGTVRLIQLPDVGVGEFLDKSSRFITEATEGPIGARPRWTTYKLPKVGTFSASEANAKNWRFGRP
jgi:hypothetical protein